MKYLVLCSLISTMQLNRFSEEKVPVHEVLLNDVKLSDDARLYEK